MPREYLATVLQPPGATIYWKRGPGRRDGLAALRRRALPSGSTAMTARRYRNMVFDEVVL